MHNEDLSADQVLRYSSETGVQYLMVRHVTSLSHSFISFAGKSVPLDIISIMYDDLWFVYVQLLS